MTSLPYQQTAWRLSDLSQGTPEEIDALFQQLEAQTQEFEALRPLLTPEIAVETFLDLIHKLERITEDTYRLYGYAGLSFSANTQDQNALTLVGRAEQFLAELQNRTLFFTLWWKGLDDENAARLMSQAGDYTYWLEEMRHLKPYTLSEAEEKIINLKNVTGASAIERLYETYTNRYTFKLEVDGEVKELTRGELMTYVRGADPDLRARAYQELYRVYGNDGAFLAQMYQNLVRDWYNENITLRGYKSPIAVRNLANDIPDEVVDTLLEVCRKNTSVFQRYFRLKARWLGMDKLRRYDIYAPVARADKAYPFEHAAWLVLDSFRQFDPQFAELAQRVFEHQHLDSEVRKGKRSGAFCWSVSPRLTPWVLLNYQGRADDVATMAHELGHAIHSMMAQEHSIFTFHASLPLAETASTFGEMMLVDRLLAEESDEAVRRDLLFRQVDDSYATIQRQAFFALFEKEAHEMVRQNASPDEMAEAYLRNLKDQFGDAVEVSDEFRWEWVSIPHIYGTPFYVYAYAFGQLLVLSLYRQFKQEGESFKPRLKQILAAGGSQSPESILRNAGVDIRQASFWQGGFDVIAQLVNQLEQIPLP
ncbi:M3 family oligoendopeptidase [Anaerolinea thermophila]|uniref:M3 family peptidase n=1 Tax=Anaerolinea thermophila (strain DSM 14523 / JCM 11388 / NBRC 100420 / UNI-1) TaxID=926569 RepID=E8N045_ANATU|nr:M3 family oligoendopeptidase [Anaerolinea thermophila]BAJ62380.1 putative M3 family peptidase [Anaerolinea thermophila UNI-1]